jgi:hypothetical protein
MSAHPPTHDFLVVGPWWTWGDPPDPAKGRLSVPSFQKYDTAKLVSEFLADPQRRLKFGVTDLVHVVAPAPAAPPSPDGKPRRFTDTVYVPDEPATRKLFLDTHKRFYLVVCQVNCDAPGFPKASRDRICKVGFVIRRRTARVPLAGVAAARAALRDLGAARIQRRKLEAAWTALRAATPAAGDASTRTLRLSDAKRAAIEERRASVQARVAFEKDRLRALVDKLGVALRLEGWFPSPTGAARVGFWDGVEEAPDDVGDEDSFPMYPLVPSPDDPNHSGQHGTIFFGIVPTGSRDAEDGGAARFDDQTLYEVRCFARRHLRPHGPGEPCPCPDQLYWSSPGERYRLAPHFDLVGTSQRPMTVQLPNLGELAAQASPTMGARFVKPPGSLMVRGNSSGGIDGHGVSSGTEICSIPIPLITIVASFVLDLFLPAVVLIFGLFWMLRLKFCIPPEIDVAAGISAEIALDAHLSAALEADIRAKVDAAYGAGSELAGQLESSYSPVALGNLAFDAKVAAATASLSAALEWEKEIAFR